MLVDGLSFLEGAINENFVIPYVTEYQRLHPLVAPTMGEVTYQVDGLKPGLYVYTGANWVLSLDVSAGGLIDITKLPAFTGDVYSQPGTNHLQLSAVDGLHTGTYQSVTVDTSGRVTSGSNPTTLVGYGITDAVSTNKLPTGDATATQLVLGNDSRLTNARTPLSHQHVSADITDFTTSVTSLISTAVSGVAVDAYTKAQSDAQASLKVSLDQADIANGYAKVQSTGKISSALVPAVPITNTTVATTTAQVTAQITAAQPGDVIIDNVTGQSLIKLADGSAVPLNVPTNTVTSINGRTGIVDKITLSDTSGIVGSNGKLNTTLVPSFIGDVTNTGLSLSLVPVNGLTPGTYTSVTVDTKGRVTGGTTGVSYTKAEIDTKLGLKLSLDQSDIANGYAKVQSTGKISSSLIPVVPITNTTVATTTAQVTTQIAAALPGDVIVNNVTGQSLIKLADGTAVPLSTPTDTVVSINGRTGVIAKIALADTTGITASNGKIDPSIFPTLTGDITNTGLTTTLATTGVSADTYDQVTVDTKGRVTGGVKLDTLPVHIYRRNQQITVGKLQINTLI